jgi:hypothetical protein
LGELNRREERLRVQIVFAGLVNDPELLVLRGVAIRKSLINLPPLQGYLITLVL